MPVLKSDLCNAAKDKAIDTKVKEWKTAILRVLQAHPDMGYTAEELIGLLAEIAKPELMTVFAVTLITCTLPGVDSRVLRGRTYFFVK